MVILWLRGEYKAEQRNLQTYLQSVASRAAVQTQDSLVMYLIKQSKAAKELGETAKEHALKARVEWEEILETHEKEGGHFGENSAITRIVLADTSMFYEFETSDSFDSVLSVANDINITVGENHEMLMTNVANKLALLLKEKELQQQFQIIAVDSGPFSTSKMATTLMRDPVSGEEYKAVFTTTKWEPLMAILPQMTFSLLLIVVVVGTLLFLKRGLAQKNRLLQLKDSFVSNMTHELKTPVATIGVALEAIKNHPKDIEQTKEYLDISSGEIDRLSMLIDRVLKMSQFENDQLQFQLEKVDISQLLDEVINISKPMLKQGQMELNTTIDIPQDTSVLGDRMHLSNVIFNLLDNSLKYCPEGSHIHQEMSLENDQVVFKHSDNGPGIPKAYQKEVFSRFFRVPTKNVHNVKGHGLGLSYVQQVVKMHKGTIDMESTEGAGTSFIIKLPILNYG